MSLFKKIFNKEKGNNKEQFLGGWEVSLDGGEHCLAFIKTQILERENAKNLDTHIHLIFGEDNLLMEGRLFSEGEQQTSGHLFDNLGIDEAKGKLKYQDLRAHKFYDFWEDLNGKHYLGGETPAGFKIPDNNCPGSFQYIGKISQEDEAFSWLPFDLNMICPIYMNIDKAWLDYSNPTEPKIINIEEINSLDTAYDDLGGDSEIIFNKVNFRTSPSNEYGCGLGFTGVPNWIQYPDIPRCPKTNRIMRFVCQLGDDTGVKTNRTNVIPEDEWYKQYFEQMNFWGDGCLFVFFEPESKTACYFIQNT